MDYDKYAKDNKIIGNYAILMQCSFIHTAHTNPHTHILTHIRYIESLDCAYITKLATELCNRSCKV